MEEKLDQQDSLRIIESMINRAKNHFSEDGHLYLLWGWLILFCSLGEFVLLHIFHAPWHSMVWLLTWVAVIYQVIYIRRKVRHRKVKTYADEVIGMVWLAFVVCIFLLGGVIGNIYLAQGKDFYAFVIPVFLVLYGIPTFVSGCILKFRPLRTGGIGCWALSVGAAFLPGDFQMLALVPAMIVAWIIPGYILRARYKQNTPGR